MICPVRALRNMIALFPAESNDPSFTSHHKQQVVPLTDFVARKHLKDISKNLGYSPSLHSICSERGVQLVPLHGVPSMLRGVYQFTGYHFLCSLSDLLCFSLHIVCGFLVEFSFKQLLS